MTNRENGVIFGNISKQDRDGLYDGRFVLPSSNANINFTMANAASSDDRAARMADHLRHNMLPLANIYAFKDMTRSGQYELLLTDQGHYNIFDLL